MCGIAGLFVPTEPARASSRAVKAMCDAIVHRGPDGDGVWTDGDAGIGLGHRRLAIIDLSVNGVQPMPSASDRWMIAFNGEIFNYRDLRRRLETEANPPAWRGHSDTEVLVEALDRWGLSLVLERIEGQFAFAAWDRQERRLFLARDRFGEKPLYYGWAGKALLFGSDLKALRTQPDFPDTIDQEALAGFVRYGFVPHPRSIWRGIAKLPPGGWTSFGVNDPVGAMPAPATYWDAGEAAVSAIADPWTGSEDDAVEALDRLLRQTVQSRMISDVPLGALLSGGVDSSAIVAMMQTLGGRVKTFTIGNSEPGFDEAGHAAAVARHLGTDHTELYATPEDALAVVPELPSIYSEPFADASQIPTYLVSRLARTKVTVALSGDAGDEIFGGYNRYFHGADIWRRVGTLPRPLRAAGAAALQAVSTDGWNRITGHLADVLPAELAGGRGGEKIHKLAGVLGAKSEADYHQGLLSLWNDPASALVSRARGLTLPGDHPPPAALSSFAQRAMYLDTRYYLADDILTKVDRASMAVSLETRAPFLDRAVFEFAWRLPMAMKIRNRRGKHILRQVLDRYVPRALIDRPKQGFAIPTGRWLRTELRDWAGDLLSEHRLKADGLFEPSVIKQVWDEHQSGKANHDTRLWTILMAQGWLDEQRGR